MTDFTQPDAWSFTESDSLPKPEKFRKATDSTSDLMEAMLLSPNEPSYSPLIRNSSKTKKKSSIPKLPNNDNDETITSMVSPIVELPSSLDLPSDKVSIDKINADTPLPPLPIQIPQQIPQKQLTRKSLELSTTIPSINRTNGQSKSIPVSLSDSASVQSSSSKSLNSSTSVNSSTVGATPVKAAPVVAATIDTDINVDLSKTNLKELNQSLDTIDQMLNATITDASAFKNEADKDATPLPELQQSSAAAFMNSFRNLTGYGKTHSRNNSDVSVDSITSATPNSMRLPNSEEPSIINEEEEYKEGRIQEVKNSSGTEMLSFRRSKRKSGLRATSDSVLSQNKIDSIPNTPIAIASITSGATSNTPGSPISKSTPTSISTATDQYKSQSPGTLKSPHDFDRSLYTEERYLDTQYRYASMKRNVEFHALFTNVPEDDRLLDDFSCALSREILLQGRMYISEHYMCFNSSLLGWVTNMVISLDEILKFERRLTAGLFPNGIIIETKDSKHTFASFLSRDQTLNFIETIWSKSVALSKSNNEECRDFEVIESRLSMNGSTSSSRLSEQDIYTIDGDTSDEDDDESEDEYSLDSTEKFTSEEKVDDSDDIKSSILSKQKSSTEPESENDSAKIYPGPESHSVTSHEIDYAANNENIVLNYEFNVPMGFVYELLFGKDTKFHQHIMTLNDGFEYTPYGTFEKAGGDEYPNRSFEYDKGLNFSIGPKSTRVECTEYLYHYDINDYIEVMNVTRTPNVPSGTSFDCRTRYVLTWGEKGVNLAVSFKLNWTASSWIKAIIESSALNGQQKAADDLKTELLKEIKNKMAEHKPYGDKKKGKKTKKLNKIREEKEIEKDSGSANNVVQAELTIPNKKDMEKLSTKLNLLGLKIDTNSILFSMLLLLLFQLILIIILFRSTTDNRHLLEQQGKMLEILVGDNVNNVKNSILDALN